MKSHRFWRALNLILENSATFLLIGFFISVLLQVFYRYVLQEPLTWTEEAARYLNMWAVFIGAALSVNHKDHLKVDLIDRWIVKRSFRFQMSFYFILTLLSALSVVALLIGSYVMTKTSWGIELTMIPLPQGVLYLGAVFCSTLMMLFFLRHLTNLGLQLARGEEENI